MEATNTSDMYKSAGPVNPRLLRAVPAEVESIVDGFTEENLCS